MGQRIIVVHRVWLRVPRYQRRALRLLITGCGRSGTTWMAAALRAAGVDCGHERAFRVVPTTNFDIYGDWRAESSGIAAPFTPMPDTYVVRLVRHPLKVIASAVHRNGSRPQSRKFVERWLPELHGIDDVPTYTARYWIGWNALIRADETIRLESVDIATVKRLARIVKPGARLARLPAPQNISPRRPRPVTWTDVRHITELHETAAEYGYLG